MLHERLGGLSLDEFRREHLGRRAFSMPGTAHAAVPICSWQTLDIMLRATPVADAMVVSRGELSRCAQPRHLRALRGLFASGIGLVIRHAQRQHAPLEQLAEAFLRDLPGELKVLVFATPKGAHGFGWHFDPEEVFIVQTAGRKQYFLRENTVVEPTPGATPPDFEAIRREVSPMFSCNSGGRRLAACAARHVACGKAARGLPFSLTRRGARAGAAHRLS